MEIILHFIVLHIYPASHFSGNTSISSLIGIIVSDQEYDRKDLQQKEKQEVKVPSNEDKNIFHTPPPVLSGLKGEASKNKFIYAYESFRINSLSARRIR